MAEAAAVDQGIPEIIINFISTDADLKKEPDLNAVQREMLTDRIGRLQAFMGIAETVIKVFAERLAALPKLKEGNSSNEDHLIFSSAPPFKCAGINRPSVEQHKIIDGNGDGMETNNQ